jgi:hypothetical protein
VLSESRIGRLIAESGLAIEGMERGYIRGPRVSAYLYRGVGRPFPSASDAPVADAGGTRSAVG